MTTSLKKVKDLGSEQIEKIAEAVATGSPDVSKSRTSHVASGIKPLPPSPKSVDLD